MAASNAIAVVSVELVSLTTTDAASDEAETVEGSLGASTENSGVELGVGVGFVFGVALVLDCGPVIEVSEGPFSPALAPPEMMITTLTASAIAAVLRLGIDAHDLRPVITTYAVVTAPAIPRNMRKPGIPLEMVATRRNKATLPPTIHVLNVGLSHCFFA